MTVLEIRARPMPSAHTGDDLPHLFMSGDLLLSHMNMISSAMFPEGEDFFVRSVRHFRDEVHDPVLKRQVAGFIGQEATHSRAHDVFNEKLAALGYPTREIDRGTRVVMGLLERVLSPKARLAVTAALEHVTATLAEQLLDNEAHRALFDQPEVAELFIWHALEESEHKAVAFDVFRLVGGSERLRIRTMRIAMALGMPGMALGVLASSLADRKGRRQRGLRESWRHLKASPFANREIWRQLKSYNQPGFHPHHHDTTELVLRWRAELGVA
jgi:predicted metal-dependent hydrolase